MKDYGMCNHQTTILVVPKEQQGKEKIVNVYFVDVM